VIWLEVPASDPFRTMGAARLCLQAFAVVLLVGLMRVAASEDDVTPRLTFPYSKCLIAAPTAVRPHDLRATQTS